MPGHRPDALRAPQRSVTGALRPAFTLVELLIVVALVAVLLALLAPAMTSAWDTAMMTKCQMNLAQIWKAQNSRRADKDQTIFTAGGAWPAMVAPYLDRAADVLRCPLGPERPDLAVMVDSGAGGTADNIGGGYDAGGPSGDGVALDTRFTLSELTFRMYAKRNFAPYVIGQYLGTAFVDSSYGVKRQDLGGGKTYFGVDDRSFFLDRSVAPGNLDYADIRFHLWLDSDRINQMEFIGSDEITGQGSHREFRFEVWLGDEMISDDFVRDMGTVVGLDKRSGGDATGGGTGGGTSGAGDSGASTLNELGAIKAFDYGLNKGTYRILDSTVQKVDPCLIFILDYGKSVANYTNKPPDLWPLYFTAAQAEWMADERNTSFLKPGETWWHYTAMRHFGMANVLFCDGHIELLGPDALHEFSPLWGIRRQ